MWEAEGCVFSFSDEYITAKREETGSFYVNLFFDSHLSLSFHAAHTDRRFTDADRQKDI